MQRYAITDRLLLPGVDLGVALRSQLERWVSGGVEWVQLRERDLPPAEIASLVRSLADVARPPGSRTRLLVNGLAPQNAAACGAYGVHLRGGSSVGDVRAALASVKAVSVSCHTLAEVREARRGGATLVLWAPVFEKTVAGEEVAAGTGLPALRAACQEAMPMPVFALGGVSVLNAKLCVEAGAAGIAGIRLFHGEAWHP